MNSKTDAEWRATLSPEQYRVLRGKGTERAFTGQFWDHHAHGRYRCAACGTPLFSSAAKFDSGTGWPSFTKPLKPELVGLFSDDSQGMQRTEVRSTKAGAHLGHRFEDGPAASGGQRFCINSAALRFVHQKDMKKEGYEKYLYLFEKNQSTETK